MSNLSIFEQNIMHAIEGAANGDADRTEQAQKIFLRWKDRDILKAERAACEWAESLQPFLDFILPVAAELHTDNPHAVFSPAETAHDVSAFIKERHVRRYFPGN